MKYYFSNLDRKIQNAVAENLAQSGEKLSFQSQILNFKNKKHCVYSEAQKALVDWAQTQQSAEFPHDLSPYKEQLTRELYKSSFPRNVNETPPDQEDTVTPPSIKNASAFSFKNWVCGGIATSVGVCSFYAIDPSETTLPEAANAAAITSATNTIAVSPEVTCALSDTAQKAAGGAGQDCHTQGIPPQT